MRAQWRLHLLSIPSGSVELADGLVYVVRVTVVQAAAEPEPGVSGGTRVSSLGKLKEARNLRKIRCVKPYNVAGVGVKRDERGRVMKGAISLASGRYERPHVLNFLKIGVSDLYLHQISDMHFMTAAIYLVQLPRPPEEPY